MIIKQSCLQIEIPCKPFQKLNLLPGKIVGKFGCPMLEVKGKENTFLV